MVTLDKLPAAHGLRAITSGTVTISVFWIILINLKLSVITFLIGYMG
jgi:hypothetical protein